MTTKTKRIPNGSTVTAARLITIMSARFPLPIIVLPGSRGIVRGGGTHGRHGMYYLVRFEGAMSDISVKRSDLVV